MSLSAQPATHPIGIIAGGGDAPKRLIAALRDTGRACTVLAILGQTDKDIEATGAPVTWLPLGAAAPARELGRREQVRNVVMLGRVRRPSLKELKPDWLMLQKLMKIGLNLLGDDGLLKAIAREIEAEGFRIIGVQDLFAEFLMPAGQLGAVAPDETAQADIARGREVALLLGQADVGQAVVVQQGIVLGLEASEGTDALVQRAGGLRREGPGGVLVKMRKPQQDRRFDLPSIGVETVRAAQAAGLAGIAAEAGSALLVNKAEVIAAADAAGIFLCGIGHD